MQIPKILLERAEEIEKYYKTHMPIIAPFVKQCFLNTIETTVKQLEDNSYFVITGDIPAMWLRDSSSQVKVYLKYSKEDEKLREIIEGVIKKQAELVLIDPYANAFNETANGAGHKDNTILNDHVWERKYEVDSLCAPIYLAFNYWKESDQTGFFDEAFHKMLRVIYETFKTEQNHEASPYFFTRDDCYLPTDTLINDGKGAEVAYTGMTWSGFRPSDDCCTYGYLIPSNMMAVVALKRGAEISEKIYKDNELRDCLLKLAAEIDEGIKKYAVREKDGFGNIYAYETDGLGNYCFMDDANSPSLLAMPYIGYCKKDDELYLNTRSFILSEGNPHFHKGEYAEGISSPHTPGNYVWHIGIIMQALTSNDDREIKKCMERLIDTDAGTNFMHESFNPDQPSDFSREWFAWANSLFAELLDELAVKAFF